MFRFVIGQEAHGPVTGYGPWAYQRYGIVNHERIILVDYSEELKAKIEQICPIPIVDYRNLPDH